MLVVINFMLMKLIRKKYINLFKNVFTSFFFFYLLWSVILTWVGIKHHMKILIQNRYRNSVTQMFGSLWPKSFFTINIILKSVSVKRREFSCHYLITFSISFVTFLKASDHLLCLLYTFHSFSNRKVDIIFLWMLNYLLKCICK